MVRFELKYAMSVLILTGCGSAHRHAGEWVVDSVDGWRQSAKDSEGLTFVDGRATPTGDTGRYRSVTRTFDTRRSATSIVFRQSSEWLNWSPTKEGLPSNLGDAPVLLVAGPDDYWAFGLYGSSRKRGGFEQEPAELEGFDVRLLTTPFPNQFDAPGGLKESLGGYHAWQSRDMVNWVHHGPVTESFSRWVTTAERVDGQTYIYYDFPNDQDPHLYIDDDLTDGRPGTNMGTAFKDPSHGSDCAFIRDLQGRFHVIYEDWSPIDASRHSWDSPLGGHAVSPDGIGDFTILAPAVDERTTPTGRFAEYPHPHWHKADPESYPVKAGARRAFGRYEIHEPEQNAYGDWAAICIGGRYYLFSDYHPAGDRIRIGWFTSPDINERFTFCGELGEGHPDPDIGFAEGRFYLVTQTMDNYVSPGPWVERVEARVGVDIDGDDTIDAWTDWQEVKETYDYIPGFSKQIERTPASIDLSAVPAGFGFCFEFRTEDTTENGSKPILESVVLSFGD